MSVEVYVGHDFFRGFVTNERHALEAAIDAAVDDPTGYAVLGDWLLQEGDARGELISLQLDPQRSKARKEREDELLRTRGIRIRSLQRAQWRWGFISTLLFELVRHDAWELHREDWPEVLLQPELEHPSCRFVRELVIDASPGDRTLDFLAAHLPRHVRSLSLICNELELPRFTGKLEQLEKLSISAQLLSGGAVTLPRLLDLSISLDAIRAPDLRALFKSVPTLKSLTVFSLEKIDAAAIDPVLEVAQLESLRIRSDDMTRSAVEAIYGSPLRQSLTTLDVSRSGLSTEGAQKLTKLTPKFAQLSNLVLGEI